MTAASQACRQPPASAALPTATALLPTALAAVAAVLVGACGSGGSDNPSPPPAPPAPTKDNTAWQWQLPAYFPPPRVPADNPMSKAKVELGRYLFYDKRLSGNGSQSCASCHFQHLAFTDGRGKALGATGVEHVRGAMSLANVAYNTTYTWANPALISLEHQIPNPIFGEDPVEMGVNDSNIGTVLQRFRDDPAYAPRFAAAFPEAGGAIGWPQIVQAITTFERTLISVNSKYDHYRQGKIALDAAEMRGWQLFQSAQCIFCHQEPNFTDQFVSSATTQIKVRYHNKGLYNVDGKGAYPRESPGAIEITTNPADMGAFRAPTLRNIAVTAPYMHDGSVATLEEVVALYAAGGRVIADGKHAGDGRRSPYKSRLLKARPLSARDQADLVAFLHTLTDPVFLTDPAFSDPFAQP